MFDTLLYDLDKVAISREATDINDRGVQINQDEDAEETTTSSTLI